MMMSTTLTPAEMMMAGTIALRRNITARRKGFRTFNGLGWDTHIEGALAEIAVAKMLNLWIDPGLDKFGAADVGEWHVRSSRHAKAHLRIEQYEKEGKYLLALGEFDSWRIAGWMDAEEARNEKYLKQMRPDRDPAYWVPAEELHAL